MATDDTAPSAATRDDQPGSVSSPQDVGGRGPVTLDDRTRQGGQGSPDTNQGKAEPVPPTPGDADPTAPVEPPTLEEMNVGGADPQRPNHPAARDRDAPDAGVVAGEPQGEAVGKRAPGHLGVSPEQQGTDVREGAEQMRPGGGPGSTPAPVEPGDAQDVPVPHDVPAAGTSEQAPIAHGVRAPQE